MYDPQSVCQHGQKTNTKDGVPERQSCRRSFEGEFCNTVPAAGARPGTLTSHTRATLSTRRSPASYRGASSAARGHALGPRARKWRRATRNTALSNRGTAQNICNTTRHTIPSNKCTRNTIESIQARAKVQGQTDGEATRIHSTEVSHVLSRQTPAAACGEGWDGRCAASRRRRISGATSA